MFFAESPRIAMGVSFADVLNALRIVRSESWVDQCDAAVVLAHAVAGRPGNHQLGTVRNGLRRQDNTAVDLVAVDYHLAGAVGVHGPKMMVAQVIPVHIFPTHVGHLPVGKNPGRVVLFHIGREESDIAAVGIALVERCHLR